MKTRKICTPEEIREKQKDQEHKKYAEVPDALFEAIETLLVSEFKASSSSAKIYMYQITEIVKSLIREHLDIVCNYYKANGWDVVYDKSKELYTFSVERKRSDYGD